MEKEEQNKAKEETKTERDRERDADVERWNNDINHNFKLAPNDIISGCCS